MLLPRRPVPQVLSREVGSRGRLVASKLRRAVPVEWRHYVRVLPIRSDEVLYESFAGNGALCHPEAIFRELVAAPDLQHLRHVWVIDRLEHHPETVAELRAMPNVRVVERGSLAYDRHLATARYLVNNATFPPTFSKRDEQTYLNTWHGTPLKRMGFDEPVGISAARNVVRNFLHADFVLSGSRYMTETMYEGAYRLENIAPRLRVIEEGNPRTDRQVLDASGRVEVLGRLRRAGVSVPPDSRVVLYAPTWQGGSFHEPQDDADALAATVSELQASLPAGDVVLLKVHQRVAAVARDNPALRGVLVPNEIPTNLVLGVTDVLVTDFSSIFFDFIVTGRPVLFHTPDLQGYVEGRGVYLDEKDLPGPRCATVPELAKLVSSVGTGDAVDPLVTHAQAHAEAVRRFAPRDDGRAAARVVDIVFRGRTEGRQVRALHRDERKRVLIYLGGMKSNGITTSALSLLAHIDPRRYDVTALFDHHTGDRAANMLQIPSQVRGLARSGGFQPGKVHWMRRRRFTNKGALMRPHDLAAMLGLLELEWRRILGGAEFDHIVDFSGYSPFWSFLMAEGEARTRSIWQHNDLRADQMRLVDGSRVYEKSLGSVFSSYYLYDRIVSVSPALRDINAAKLAEFAPPEKFTWAHNLIDAARIRDAVDGDAEARASWPGDHLFAVHDLHTPPEVRADLWRRHPAHHGELERRWAVSRSPRRDGVFQFVTVGRLSPEKNHERLVRAFGEVHREHPHTRLVLIGNGPLTDRVRDVVDELGLEDAVELTGLLRNPWALMNECDAFVLSSDYEGQPMVILEARVLGLPILTTAFGSVEGSVRDGVDGMVVDRDVSALADGMRALVRQDVPNPRFDAEAYNAEATEEFYRAIGLTDD